MLKSEEIVVDDRKYRVSQYTAGTGLKIFTKLAKLIGGPLSMLASKGMDAEVSGDLLGNAVSALTSQLEPDATLALTKEILLNTQISDNDKYRDITFDYDFAGRFGHLSKLLKEILKFQYADFLGELVAITPNISASKTIQRVKAL